MAEVIRFHDLIARSEARRQARRVDRDQEAQARVAARIALYRRAESDRRKDAA